MRLDEAAYGGRRRVVGRVVDPMPCHRGRVVGELLPERRIATIAYGRRQPGFKADRAGLPLDQAIYAGAIYDLGAFVGTTPIGVLAVRFRLNRASALFLVAAAAAMLVFGGVAMPVRLTLLTALAVGATVQGGF